MVRRALPLLLAFSLAARAGAAAAPRGIGDYEIILDKAPFGPPPPTAGASADADAAAAAARAAAEAAARAAASPPPPAPVRLSSLARYGGVASAGLVENASGRLFVLRPGECWGPYRLLEADPEAGSALVAQGTNEFFVALSWGPGQATNLVPSARAPYLTTFRADRAGTPAAGPGARDPGPGSAAGNENETEESGGPDEEARAADGNRRTAANAAFTEEEEADLVRRATVTDPDGSTHVSFRELNRLRVELRRRKAEAARAEALAAAERRRAERQAAEEEAAAERLAAERERREAVVEALAQGYDVEVDFELSDVEAARLREAGFDVPGEVDE